MSGGLTPRKGILAAALVVAALALVPSTAAAVTFFRGDFPAGTHPTSVAVGNFNGGAPDLAVADEASDAVSILLGNGFGQFTPAGTVAAGSLPSSVVVGRFNADSFDDLAIASVGNDNVAIKLGDGSGGFSGTGTVSAGASSDPRAIATGDFNNDGKADLVSANMGSSTVSIMLGDGMGGFAADPSPENVAASAANPVSVAPIRLDNPAPPGTPDPNLDVMIASQTKDQVLSLFGDGTGGFGGSGTNYTGTGIPGSDPSAIAVGSLNPASPNPGFAAEQDVLIANQGVDQVWPAFGRTDGSAFDFGGVLATEDQPVSVAFGDLDGDGDPDGISANQGGNSATSILSDGTGGTSVDTNTQVGLSPRSVTTGAFDGDNRADVAVANYDSNSVTILSSLAPGPPAAPPGTTNPPVTKKKKCKKKKHRAAAAKKKCKRKKR
jgi:hypothetical protein